MATAEQRYACIASQSACRQFILPQGWQFIDTLRKAYTTDATITESTMLQIMSHYGGIYNGTYDCLRGLIEPSDTNAEGRFLFWRVMPEPKKRYKLQIVTENAPLDYVGSNAPTSYRICLQDTIDGSVIELASCIMEADVAQRMYQEFAQQWKHAEKGNDVNW